PRAGRDVPRPRARRTHRRLRCRRGGPPDTARARGARVVRRLHRRRAVAPGVRRRPHRGRVRRCRGRVHPRGGSGHARRDRACHEADRMSTTRSPVATPVAQRMSTLDRLLPVWIGLAMVTGLLAGRWMPGIADVLDAITVGSISLPIALGLLVMMYPVLAKVRYDEPGTVVRDRRTMALSLVLNWLVGPALMFALAWTFLADLPDYRTGLIIGGLARCLAMAIIWNDLACGDREAAAVLVAINSIFQVLAFGLLGWFYLELLPGWLGLSTTGLDVSPWEIAGSVVVFLGVPLAAGYLSRRIGERSRGRAWYEETFLPRIGPWALYGLLFTIVVLFALQGDTITSQPLDVARIAVPLLFYFVLMWAGSMLVA